MKNYILSIPFLFFAFISWGQCFPDRHSTQWQDAWYSCELTADDPQTDSLNHWVMYDFGSNHQLGKIQIWNFNASPSGLKIGVRLVKPFFSKDSINWTEGPVFELDSASGFDDYEGEMTQNFNIKTRYVHLSILETHGDTVCAGISHIRFYDTPATFSAKPKLSMAVYPNPSQGMFSIELKADTKGYIDIELRNAIGELLRIIRAEGEQILYNLPLDISNVPNGIYFLSARQGNEVVSEKLVKHD